MAVTYNDLFTELSGQVPGLSPFLAKKFINRAWRDILNARDWSFLLGFGGFNAPSAFSDGTANVTQGVPAVVMSSLAAAAIDAVPSTQIVQRQFRIAAAGGIYSIAAWDTSTNTLTLDRPILEATAATATYSIFQCYFPPPPEAFVGAGQGYDFNNWISILDPVTPINVGLDKDKQWLDFRDPQRSDGGPAYYFVNYTTTAAVIPLYEAWPHPTGGQQYVTYYKRFGLPFLLGQTPLPQPVPDSLVIDRAMYKYVSKWVALNVGTIPALQKVNWAMLMTQARIDYKADLQAAKIEDENVYMTALIGSRQFSGYGPIDASYLQRHSTGLERYGR